MAEVMNPERLDGRTLSRMSSVGAICFEDRFCTGKKGVIGGGGWVHPGVPCTWYIATLAG